MFKVTRLVDYNIKRSYKKWQTLGQIGRNGYDILKEKKNW